MLRRALLLPAALVLSVALPLAPSAQAAAASPTPGVDLSHWQHDAGPLDWPAVHTSQAFAIAKATDGATFVDPTYLANVTQARAQGLVVGSYHYAEPQLPMSTALTQADFYASTIGSVQEAGTLPPILDLETPGTLTTPGQLVAWTQTFLDELMTRTGRTPVVYTGRNFWLSRLNNSAAFTRFPLWVVDVTPGAATPVVVGGWTSWALWQWGSGTVAGVTGPVDEDRFNGDAAALATFADGSHPTVLPAVVPQAPSGVTTAVSPAGLTVGWQPGDDGGQPLTSYTVRLQPGGASVTVAGSETSAVLTGLDPALSYTATVAAASPAGSSAPSVPSAASTPVAVLRVSSTSRTVSAGHNAVLTGTLVRSVGLGAPGPAPLVLWAKKPAVAPVPVRRITTSATGSFAVTVKLVSTTRYIVRYEAGPGWPDASASLPLTAQAVLKAAVNHRSIARGAKVTLSGAVSAVAAGRLVFRQRFYAGAWHDEAHARVSRTGHFAFVVKGSRRGTSKLRVRLPSSASLHGTASDTLLLTVH